MARECKVCLVTAAGEVIRAAREGYPTHSPRPAWAEQDPADWLQAIVRATRRLLAETDFAAQHIVGLALTSAAHIGVLVDADGVPVRRALLRNDQRSSAEVADLERDHGDEILRRTYQAVSPSWPPPGQGRDDGSFRRPRTRRGMGSCFPSMSGRKRNSAHSITRGG